MGGPGSPSEAQHGLSDIDLALLEEVDRLMAGEWCGHWAKVQPLQPVLLGHENSGRFLQTSQPDAAVFELLLEARLGDAVEQITMGFPFATLEPLIRALVRVNRSVPATTPDSPPKWSCDFDDVQVSMIAEHPGIKLTARELTHLKPGDVIPLPPSFPNEVRLSVANRTRFAGRLGACAGHAAVELTRVLPA
jgi:flagellar motor switch protein FliM